MSSLANLLWFLLGGGLLSGLAWWLSGAIMHLMVVTIPFGVACFRIASFAFFPFGKELLDVKYLGEKRIFGTGLANFLWFVCCGWWVAIVELFAACWAIATCVLVLPIFLGAPLWAVGHLKMAGVALFPLGRRVVSVQEAQAARMAYYQRRHAINF